MTTELSTEYIRRYNMLPPGSRVLCAVSGGADSMCLLLWLLGLSKNMGFSVCCAHFNHMLRGAESDGDEEYVRSVCNDRGVEFLAGRGDVTAHAKEHGLGTEEAAREMRYAFLADAAQKLGADIIATAHTADDNAETILLNLARGSGSRGLSGIPPVRGNIIRPMLCVTRAQVESFLRSEGVSWRTDSTNLTDDYARNRIRHNAIPVLKNINPAFAAAASRTAALLREDDTFLESLAADFIRKELKDGDKLPADKLLGLPRPVASRALRQMSKKELSASHIEALLDLCASDDPFAKISIPGCVVRREYSSLIFGEATANNGIITRSVIPGESLDIPEAGLRLNSEIIENYGGIYSSLNTFYFQCAIICGSIVVRRRLPGDCIRLPGRDCTKTLKKLFSEARIPLSARDLVPVIADDNGVLAVYGFGAAERCAPVPGEPVFKIEILKTGDNSI